MAQYNLTDHLGNVRSVVNGSGTVLQSTDYYPFGLAFSDSNISGNRYLYNGKELEDYTVGTSYLGTLDYGARHYDPRIGRWNVPDPMAEKYYGMNGYGYCAENPIRFIDHNGRELVIKGNLSNDALSQLQERTKNRIQLTRDSETGIISYIINKGKRLKGDAKIIVAIINDPNITVNVHSYDIDPHSYDVDPLEEGRAFKEQSLFACKQAAA
ncbi:MAG: RHS repeat-associated core domain-containing protein [Bacteroidales bacterium]|nr:RHS repeat-associated core domain-containing protein [Bacteroidales bacterium]